MTLKLLCLFLMTLIMFVTVAAQSEDELQIPVENDNQFPPDIHLKTNGDVIEGSGAGVIEEAAATEATESPKIEEVESKNLPENGPSTISSEADFSCPKPCLCNTEGNSNNFIVDCSGYGLTEFPTSIDFRTTTLNVQNNKLTEIPREVSTLKNLKVLNANNNSLMSLALGSISELPELVTLKLAYNRLMEYPKDLKNSFALTKLEELDIGGNDMRSSLTSEIFSNFKSLRKLTLPISTPELIEDLCSSLKASLETICTESCTTESSECPNAPQNIGEQLIDATLPGMIAFSLPIEDNIDPNINSDGGTQNNEANSGTEDTPLEKDVLTNDGLADDASSSVSGVNDFSLRSAVIKVPAVGQSNSYVDVPKETASNKDSDVKVGATTSDTKPGGIDKSVIGIIAAGMVLVIAVVTIKKNWTSIKKRFSTTQRPTIDRVEGNANGTAPEEVPLQDKSPA